MIQNLQEIQFSYDKQPLAVFLLGTNRSGKSTLREHLNLSNITINIDPDLLNKSYKVRYPDTYETEAAKEALTQVNNAIAKGLNFCIESTLAGHGTMQRIRRAKAAGFHVIAYYVSLDDIGKNLSRIKARVAKGGHDIPEATVRRRYKESNDNFLAILPFLDEVYILDNSESFKIIAKTNAFCGGKR